MKIRKDDFSEDLKVPVKNGQFWDNFGILLTGNSTVQLQFDWNYSANSTVQPHLYV